MAKLGNNSNKRGVKQDAVSFIVLVTRRGWVFLVRIIDSEAGK
jgi:hypothetical protein